MKILIIPALAVIAGAAGIGGAILFERFAPSLKPSGFEALEPPVEITKPAPKDPGRMEDSLLPIWMALPLVEDSDYALRDARIDYLAHGITYRLNFFGEGEPDLAASLAEIRAAFDHPLSAACNAIGFSRYPDEPVPIKLVVGDLKASTEIPAGACRK